MLAFLVADGHRRVAKYPRDRFDDLGTFWRILTALCWLVVPASFFSYVFGRSVGTGLLATSVFLAGMVWFLLSPLNIAEQVRIASLGGERLDRILLNLDAELKILEGQSRNIVIVAHSQGGFLTYELLRRIPWDRVKKVQSVNTIGSGLRGILSMRTFSEVGFTMFMSLIVTGSALAAVFPILDCMVVRFFDKLVILIGVIVQILAFPTINSSFSTQFALAFRDFAMALFHGASDGFKSMTSPRWLVIATSIVVYVGLLIYNTRKQSRQIQGDSLDLVKELRIRRWCEYFSVHDIVGRVQSVREIYGLETNDLPGEGSPLGDHSLKQYLSSSSPLPILLAAEFARLLKLPQASVHLADIESGLNIHRELSRRTYLRRAMTVLNIFTLALLSALPHGSFTIKTLAWPLWATLGVSIVAHFISRRSARKRAASIWSPSTHGQVVDRRLIDASIPVPNHDAWLQVTAISTAMTLGAAYYVNGIPGIFLHEWTGIAIFYIGIMGSAYFAPRFGAGYPVSRVRAYFGALIIGLLPLGILFTRPVSYSQGVVFAPYPVGFFFAVCYVVFVVHRKKLLV
ncbi:hypothetical protein [Mycobacteroides chelonae]|uniref:hypothetical protein n=1 Tax=Mycobacteroides chelonae TaxID=1774 RepID=UPI0012FF99AF|nr:hypothetical protein [Mycobacteroides chelonae]